MADDTGRINQVLTETSFLFGGNAAFVEGLYERYGKDPTSVDAVLARLLRRSATSRRPGGQAASWTGRPPRASARPDSLSAIDGLWPAVEAKVAKSIAVKEPDSRRRDVVHAKTMDSVRAIMMIRAFPHSRPPRGQPRPPRHRDAMSTRPSSTPAPYGFSDSDLDRPIFIDFVLGLETATLREILEILRRTYCGNVGVQYMHISDPEEKAWIQERIEGRGKEIAFTKEGKLAILKKLIEAEAFERFLHKRFPGTKRFGLDGGEADGPGARADHQARRPPRRRRDRHRHAAPRPPQRAGRRDGQALHGSSSTSSRAARRSPRTSPARAT